MSTFLKSCVINKTFSRLYSCDPLKIIVGEKIKCHSKIIAKFRKEHGNAKLGDITVNMVYGGMRGMVGLVYETSRLNPEKGIKYRGYGIPECLEKLPKFNGSQLPIAEGVFWLMLTGEIPTEENVCMLAKNWAERSTLPEYIVNIINSFPKDLHPMAQLSATVTCLHKTGLFVKAYNKGVKKNQYWEYIYEDAMNLIAKITVIAAKIFQNCYRECPEDVEVDCDKDWACNYACMMGFNKAEFVELARLYMILHCDHEGGNVSAHTTHLVGSALSDPYLSYGAGINGLAGPLHGLANQEVLKFLTAAKKQLGDKIDDKKLEEFVKASLKSGKVIPGYGHAILRVTDTRFISLQQFGMKYLPNDPLLKLCAQMFKVVPPILKATGKIANPWPNVDAHSGVLLQYYGLTQMNYYTVMFAVSRCLGVMAAMIWSRGLGLPIERPKSLTTEKMMELVAGEKKK